MTDQELVAAYLASRSPTRVPRGRKTYSRRAMKALGEGTDRREELFRQDVQIGYVDGHGRKSEEQRAIRRAARARIRARERQS